MNDTIAFVPHLLKSTPFREFSDGECDRLLNALAVDPRNPSPVSFREAVTKAPDPTLLIRCLPFLEKAGENHVRHLACDLFVNAVVGAKHHGQTIMKIADISYAFANGWTDRETYLKKTLPPIDHLFACLQIESTSDQLPVGYDRSLIILVMLKQFLPALADDPASAAIAASNCARIVLGDTEAEFGERVRDILSRWIDRIERTASPSHNQ